MKLSYTVGWDVGAWATKGGDALWILDASKHTHGKPAHGNLGNLIERSGSAEKFVRALFNQCEAEFPSNTSLITMAIDAPLSFPVAFVKLIDGIQSSTTPLGKAVENPYLFRPTEKYAAKVLGRNPLSSIQDQIGSQTTKIAHMLAKFKFKNNEDGAWICEVKGKPRIHVIEAYPAMSKMTRTELLPGPLRDAYDKVLASHSGWDGGKTTEDERDALICALVGHMYQHRREELQPPPKDFPFDDGWIWFPTRKMPV